jgi:hypothetical protein
MLELIYEKLNKLITLIGNSRNRNGIIQVEPIIRHSRVGVDSFCLTSHDFGDPTTWFQNSVKEQNHSLQNMGDNKTYASAFPNWINIDSHRLAYADKYTRALSSGGYSFGSLPDGRGNFLTKDHFRVKVTLNNEDVSPDQIDINYPAGQIVFKSARSQTDQVRAYFHYANPIAGSQIVVRPPEARFYSLEHTELQISASANGVFPSIVFQLWAGNPGYEYDFQNPMHHAYFCQYEQRFRCPQDYINIGNEGKGSIPKFGSLTSDVLVFPFNYMNSISLGDFAPGGQLVRVYIENEHVFTNTELATFSFYIEDRPLVEYV